MSDYYVDYNGNITTKKKKKEKEKQTQTATNYVSSNGGVTKSSSSQKASKSTTDYYVDYNGKVTKRSESKKANKSSANEEIYEYGKSLTKGINYLENEVARIKKLEKQVANYNRLPALSGQNNNQITAKNYKYQIVRSGTSKPTLEEVKQQAANKNKNQKQSWQFEKADLGADAARKELANANAKYGSKEKLNETLNTYKGEYSKIESQYKNAEKKHKLEEKITKITQAKDFAKYSVATKSKPNEDGKGSSKYDFINNIDDYRNFVGAMSAGNGQTDKYGAYTAYAYLEKNEIGVYNYLYAKEGKKKADEFLDAMEETLNERRGITNYENMGTVRKALYWLPAGIENTATNM